MFGGGAWRGCSPSIGREMWFPRSELSNFALHLRGNRAAWELGKWASGGGGGGGGGQHHYREVCLNNIMSQALKKGKEKSWWNVQSFGNHLSKLFVSNVGVKFPNNPKLLFFCCFFPAVVVASHPGCYNVVRHSVSFHPELVSNSTTKK